jgi:hypothetical protein
VLGSEKSDDISLFEIDQKRYQTQVIEFGSKRHRSPPPPPISREPLKSHVQDKDMNECNGTM